MPGSRGSAAVASVEAGKRKRRTAGEINRRILAAAKEEFIKSGYAATSAAIAAKAEVTEGQLYRYFDSKNDIFREAILKPLDKKLLEFGMDYVASVAGIQDRKKRLRLYIDKLQGFIKQHPELLQVITASINDGGELKAVEELKNLAACFDIGSLMLQDRKGSDLSIEPGLMVKIIFSTVLSSLMFRDWLYQEETADKEAFFEAISEFLVGAVYATDT